MTQVHNLSHSGARLARVLESVNKAARGRVGSGRWEPSREEMIKMRQLSRQDGMTLDAAYEAMMPPCSLRSFQEKAKKLAIYYDGKYNSHCNPRWYGK